MWTPEVCALQLCLFRRRAPPTPAHAASRGSEGLLSLPFGQGSLLLPRSPDPLETPRPRRGCPLGKLPSPPCAWPGSPPTPALFRFVSRCGVQGSIAPVTPVLSDSSFLRLAGLRRQSAEWDTHSDKEERSGRLWAPGDSRLRDTNPRRATDTKSQDEAACVLGSRLGGTTWTERGHVRGHPRGLRPNMGAPRICQRRPPALEMVKPPGIRLGPCASALMS